MGEQLTESDVKKIKEEIEYRKIVVRKKELEAVKEARAQGDLSENFEYKAAKQDKNRNESRIRYLERMLKTANIVSDDSKEDEIGINNTVDLYFEDDEEVETYRIVTSVRGNSLAGLISIESPLGKAAAKPAAAEEDVKEPPKEIVTAQIAGIEVMDLEDAVKALWKINIYAESGMGCTGPIIRVSDANLEKAHEELKKAGYIN